MSEHPAPSRLPFPALTRVFSEKGRWALQLVLQRSDGAAELWDMIDCVASLSRWGAFAAAPQFLGSSALRIENLRVAKETEWQAEIALSHSQPGLWRALLQMLAQCHHFVCPIEQLRIIPTGLSIDSGLPSDAETALSADYPRPVDPLPFALDNPPRALRPAETVRLAFASDLTEEQEELIRKVCDDWACLVYTGGFSAPDQSLDDFQVTDLTFRRIHARLFECSLECWEGEEASFGALINAVAGLTLNSVPIVEMEIE